MADADFLRLVGSALFGIVDPAMGSEFERSGNGIACVAPEWVGGGYRYEGTPYAFWLTEENAVEARRCILLRELIGFSIPWA